MITKPYLHFINGMKLVYCAKTVCIHVDLTYTDITKFPGSAKDILVQCTSMVGKAAMCIHVVLWKRVTEIKYSLLVRNQVLIQ